MNKALKLWPQKAGVAAFSLLMAASAAQADCRKVVIGTDGSKFEVLSQIVVAQDPPNVYRLTFSDGFYYVEAKNPDGKIVKVESLPESSEVLYDYVSTDRSVLLPPPSTAASTRTPVPLTGGSLKNKTNQLVINLPANEKISQLKIYRQRVAHTQGATAPKFLASINTQTNAPEGLSPNVTFEPAATIDLPSLTIGGDQ